MQSHACRIDVRIHVSRLEMEAVVVVVVVENIYKYTVRRYVPVGV